MSTINISLPKILYQKVNEIVAKEGYTSRSEFFRTLLRIYTFLKGEDFSLLEFKKKPLREIENKLKATGFYSQNFIKSVVSGLKKSSVYANKAAKKRS